MMQAQLDRTRAETNAMRDAKDKAERIMEGLGSIKVEDELVSNLTTPKKQESWGHESEIWTEASEDF